MPQDTINAKPIPPRVKEFFEPAAVSLWTKTTLSDYAQTSYLRTQPERSDPQTFRLQFETYTRRTTVALCLSNAGSPNIPGVIIPCRAAPTNRWLPDAVPSWLMAWSRQNSLPVCIEEGNYVIAQAGQAQIDEGHFGEDLVTCRSKANPACSAATGLATWTFPQQVDAVSAS